jgi:organic hydroperoxide reductase OsmC/OhrA
VERTGSGEFGTSNYGAYSRDHEIRFDTTPVITDSAIAFLDNAARRNPFELLVASLSQCHMLWSCTSPRALASW